MNERKEFDMKNPQVHQSKPIVEKVQIEKILAMRETQKALRERLALIEKAIGDAEGEVIGLVESGADTTQAGYAVSVSVSERRYPSWKEHFISLMGKEKADQILEQTTPTIYRRLVVK